MRRDGEPADASGFRERGQDRMYESEIARYQAIAKSINLQPQQ